MSRVRVLIVDDSATMRGLIAAVLRRDPEIEVIGSAGDPLEARQQIKALNPDVITLDIEMPNMNGIEFLEKIMRLRPMPVVMVSTLTQSGAEASLAALELGAFDCVGKPVHGESAGDFGRLIEAVKAAASSRVFGAADRQRQAPQPDFRSNGRVLAVGSSTGGVEALMSLLSAFPQDCPPTVITQHMPASFTRNFADRLNRVCRPQIEEASDGARLAPGRVYIAPGGETHLEVTGAAAPVCRLTASQAVSGHRPSVDVLFDSMAATMGASAVGLILTGMGKDGARGLLAMRQAGAATFGQNEATCVVYGMPKAAMEIGAVEHELPLQRLAGAVLGVCGVARQEVR